jgi:hypothetical protein
MGTGCRAPVSAPWIKRGPRAFGARGSGGPAGSPGLPLKAPGTLTSGSCLPPSAGGKKHKRTLRTPGRQQDLSVSQFNMQLGHNFGPT